MSTIAAIGSTHELVGFALVGVSVFPAATDDAVVESWNTLGRDVGLVILTTASRQALESHLAARPETLTVVMP